MQGLGIGHKDKARVSEMNLTPADRGRNVSGALTHAVAFVAGPVRQHNVDDATRSRVRHQRAQEDEVRARWKKVEPTERHVKAGEARGRSQPGLSWNKQQR